MRAARRGSARDSTRGAARGAVCGAVWHGLTARGRRVGRLRSSGMTTAEYAVGTLAAVAFAAVLLAVVKSGAVMSALTGIITTALGSAG
jgi:hypothetical protein